VSIDPAAYGDLWAPVYDEEHTMLDPSSAVDCLVDLADGGGRILELGIGTGRIALPLLQRGMEVVGVDASAAMVERMRAKPRGNEIEVIFGDMVSTDLGGPYQLAFLAFNTLFGLVDQASQVACFQNVARSLDHHGRFVIECFVPDLTRFSDGDQTVRAVTLSASGSLRFNVSIHHPAEQRVDTDVVLVRDGAIRVLPISIRYAWPAELDLMAQLAGLELDQRYAGWDRQPFTSASTTHVSVYRLRGPSS
jgi:SAM-dependent methyltransferase